VQREGRKKAKTNCRLDRKKTAKEVKRKGKKEKKSRG
jgi:hypothetical protein